jgi:hypothetical protein
MAARSLATLHHLKATHARAAALKPNADASLAAAATLMARLWNAGADPAAQLAVVVAARPLPEVPARLPVFTSDFDARPQ